MKIWWKSILKLRNSAATEIATEIYIYIYMGHPPHRGEKLIVYCGNIQRHRQIFCNDPKKLNRKSIMSNAYERNSLKFYNFLWNFSHKLLFNAFERKLKVWKHYPIVLLKCQSKDNKYGLRNRRNIFFRARIFLISFIFHHTFLLRWNKFIWEFWELFI